MSTARPFLAVFISTQPDLSSIAKCWRDVFLIELKIPFRGFFEVHMLDTYSPFRDPLNPRVRLAYKTEGTFPDMEPEDQAWYVPWRKKKAHELKRDIYNKPQEESKRPLSQYEFTRLAREMRIKGDEYRLRELFKRGIEGAPSSS